MFKDTNVRYEMDDRHQRITCGRIGVIHLMAKRLGLGGRNRQTFAEALCSI
jgi:hypothetical protein